MELILIRHTKVALAKGICYGFTDVDTAETFEPEALQISNKLKLSNFDEIWTSPLKRCFKLAEHLFNGRNIYKDDRLKELNFGDWELKTWDKIANTTYGKIWMDDFVNQKCPNGESFQDQYERVVKFYKAHETHFKNKRIAIVAHGGTIRSLLCYLQNIDLRKAFEINIDYASITKITPYK